MKLHCKNNFNKRNNNYMKDDDEMIVLYHHYGHMINTRFIMVETI